MAILKFVLIAHLIIYGFSALIGCIRFLIDVRKWHNQETKVEITASAERSDCSERTGDNRTGDRGNNNGDTGDGTRDRDNNDSTGDGNGDNDNNSDIYDW